MTKADSLAELPESTMAGAAMVGALMVAVGARMQWLGPPESSWNVQVNSAIYGVKAGYQPPDAVLLALALVALAGAGYYREQRRGAVVAIATGCAVMAAATAGLLVAYQAVVATSGGTLTIRPAVEPGFFATLAGAGTLVLSGAVQLATDDLTTRSDAARGRRSSTYGRR